MSAPDPTADYRKYSKGPNFLGIVIGSSIALLLVLAVALFFLHRKENPDAGKAAGPYTQLAPAACDCPRLRPPARLAHTQRKSALAACRPVACRVEFLP